MRPTKRLKFTGNKKMKNYWPVFESHDGLASALKK